MININNDPKAPIEVIIVHIIPGFQNPAEFTGVRITIKSRKEPKRVQVEAAIPNIVFPEDSPEKAKEIVLDQMLDAIKLVEDYANKNKIINGELDKARSVIQELWEKWDVSDFKYEIPKDLPYYDLPERFRRDGYNVRTFIEKLPGGGERHYNVLLDQEGKEVA